jgi:TonB family protein
MHALGAETLPQGLKRTLWISAAAHVGIIVALVVASLEGRGRPMPQAVLTTKLVRLGKERPPELLPRKVAPPPEPQTPAPALSSQSSKDSATPSAKDRIKQLSQVNNALDRLRQETQEDPDGHPDGVRDGDVSDAKLAVLGNMYGTEITRCLQKYYAIEGIEPAKVKNLKTTIVLRIDAKGEFMSHRIDHSSGLAAFDRAVEQAVKRCGGVSPPPKELRDDVQRDGILVEFTPF